MAYMWLSEPAPLDEGRGLVAVRPRDTARVHRLIAVLSAYGPSSSATLAQLTCARHRTTRRRLWRAWHDDLVSTAGANGSLWRLTEKGHVIARELRSDERAFCAMIEPRT